MRGNSRLQERRKSRPWEGLQARWRGLSRLEAAPTKAKQSRLPSLPHPAHAPVGAHLGATGCRAMFFGSGIARSTRMPSRLPSLSHCGTLGLKTQPTVLNVDGGSRPALHANVIGRAGFDPPYGLRAFVHIQDHKHGALRTVLSIRAAPYAPHASTKVKEIQHETTPKRSCCEKAICRAWLFRWHSLLKRVQRVLGLMVLQVGFWKFDLGEV